MRGCVLFPLSSFQTPQGILEPNKKTETSTRIENLKHIKLTHHLTTRINKNGFK